ncbi:MAG: hypothetical protein ABSG20_02925, partial [Bradyrhizobium sp.]
ILGLVAAAQMMALGSVRPVVAETFAYVGNADSNEVFVFGMDAKTGVMTLLQKAPFVGIEKPGASTRMDQTSGVLSKLQSYAVGRKPNWVEFAAFQK